MRDRLTDLGYAVGWRAARAVPAGVAGGLLRAGADLVARRGGAGPRQLRANLARVLRYAGVEPTEERLDAVTEAGLRSYARYWCEAFRLPGMDPAELHAAVDPTVGGVAHLERALANGRGVLAALTHSGNWDVAGVWLLRALAARGEPATFVTVVERLQPDSLYNRFVAYRESLGFEVLAADGGPRMVATLAARLRQNRVVCLLADRELTDGGIEVDLCGEPARLPGGPARLAARTGAALLPFGCWFTSTGWGLRFQPPIEPAPGPAGPAAAVMTQALADAFGADLTAHPVDWHMLQPIWSADRSRRPGPVSGVVR